MMMQLHEVVLKLILQIASSLVFSCMGNLTYCKQSYADSYCVLVCRYRSRSTFRVLVCFPRSGIQEVMWSILWRNGSSTCRFYKKVNNIYVRPLLLGE